MPFPTSPPASAEPARLWPVVDGRPVHTRVWGAGTARPPVVLVHGLIVSGRYMAPTARRLAPDYRVYVPDLPGFGRSPGPRQALDVPALADVLAAWMEALGLTRAAFIGNSFGCQVLVEFALRHPERVDRLVLQGPSGDPATRSPWQQLIRLLSDAPFERLSLVPLYLRDFYDAGPRRSLQTLRILLGDRIEEKLPAVPAPVLLVRGGRDPIATRGWVDEMVQLLPEGRVVELPDAPHAVNFSAPDEFARVVRPFLREARPPAGSS